MKRNKTYLEGLPGIKDTLAIINKNGRNSFDSIFSALASVKKFRFLNFGIVTPSKILLEKDLNCFKKLSINSPLLIGYVFSIGVSNKAQTIHILNDSILVFDGQKPFQNRKNQLIKDFKITPNQTLEKLASNLIINGEGAFIFAIIQKNQLILGRDSIGIHPFYYSENKNLIAFATNRKILWNLKFENPFAFPPGRIGIVNQSGLKFRSVKNFVLSNPLSLSLKQAATKLYQILDNSVSSQVSGLTKCAIAFSGGLDSSLIAFLLKKYVKHIQLIHVSLENKYGIEEAKNAAKILDLPIKIYQYKEGDVKKIISKIIWLIEDPDPVKLSIGIPFYWIAEKTIQNGFETLLAGQGADELFGGYKRYLDAYLLKDQRLVTKQLFSDIVNLHENNLSRDMKLCNYHGVDLLCPFITPELVEFALRLPLELKIEPKSDSLRKIVLRQVGHDLKLPSSIVDKPKKALQYSTGVNKVLKKIAKKNKKILSEYVVSLFQNQRLREK